MAQFILIAHTSGNHFSGLVQAFEDQGLYLVSVSSVDEALSAVRTGGLDLFVFEEIFTEVPGRDFMQDVVMANPMLNCVIASNKSHKEFHNTYEGLGVLMQVPDPPEKEDASRILSQLEKVEDTLMPER